MFSFTESSYEVIDQNISQGEAIKKYADKYMIIMRGHLEDSKIHGDIVAVLSKEEYRELEEADNIVPKFTVWVGSEMYLEEANSYLGILI